MKFLLSCRFNMDNACVELWYSDGTYIAIDTIAVERELADNMYEQSELDYLIYNDPLSYAELILSGNPVSVKPDSEPRDYLSRGRLISPHNQDKSSYQTKCCPQQLQYAT